MWILVNKIVAEHKKSSVIEGKIAFQNKINFK